jgi:hypothetical protein
MSELHKKNDVSDLDSVLSFSPAGAVPRWFHARGKDDFFSSHGLDSSRTISPLRPTLRLQL